MAMCTDDMTRNIQAKNIYPVARLPNRAALLINNMHFYDPALTRHGADKDEQAMVTLLHTLGYEVERHRDLVAQKMDEALTAFSRSPKLALADGVLVVLMSHGSMGTICGSGSHRMETDRIYERLNARICVALKDKPKIVIIQASGGVYVPGRPPVLIDNIRARSVNQAARLHTEKDFFTFHSSELYLTAYKHAVYGSFFVQSIVEVFNIWCLEDPIDKLFKKVMQRFHFLGLKQQMPNVELHTLTKLYYLFPGKMQLSIRHEDPRGRPDTLRAEPAGVRWVRSELRKCSYQLTIDMNTVNRKLKMSHRNSKVKYVSEPQRYPDHPDRFDRAQLLCRDRMTGRGYWEVEWTGEVYIAVSYRGIRRKGESNETLFGWNNQSWCLYCSDKYTVWHDSKEMALSSRSYSLFDSDRVAVYLDCHAGTLSFLRVSSDTLTHLHTFKTKFTEPVYPGFRVFTASSMRLC